ncbi:ADA HAT complex component 1 [Fonsecaea pedrosoi]|nr:ADA HAT complex component 1 [Fonsecaea pedrosoi]
MPATHKRKQSTDTQSQSERKRAKFVDKEAGAHVPPNSTRALPPDTLKIAGSSPNDSPSFLPTPPEQKMEDSEMRQVESPQQDADAARLQSIRNVIQTQISLEILLKHNELRLIDQEIAKSQASLEQLRRCKEIPFPATQHLSIGVSNGTGPALRSSFPPPLPQSPASWGVQDGPYSRHYAKWLLSDPRFDGGEQEPIAITPVGKSPMKFRSQTRGQFAEGPQSSSQARAQRSGKLKSLPAGYGQPKEKATGPMIIKRKSDGATVKLVCPDCGRFDFGSAQGFINHCRIGHGRSFASHDAAADACGEPVEVDETGAMIGVEPTVTPVAGNVHPLIRSAKLLIPTPPRTSQTTPSTTPTTGSVKRTQVSPDFRASALTPNLSELVKARGLGIDLQEMVLDAKTKIELPESDSEDDEMEIDIPMQHTGQGRHPQVAGSKQPPKPTKSPMSSPLLNSSMLRSNTNLRGGVPQYDGADDKPTQHRPRGMTLPMNGATPSDIHPSDPSPTSESNQAPSLVDDDEFEPHSPSSSSASDEHDDNEVEFEVQGDDDDARSVLRGPDFQPSCTQAVRPPTHARRASAIRRHGEEREEKHVTFVSPSPARDMPDTRLGGDRKRRKA